MRKFKYIWKNGEANFGPPVETEVSGGTHISAENILKFNGKYVALRRPRPIPEGTLRKIIKQVEITEEQLRDLK